LFVKRAIFIYLLRHHAADVPKIAAALRELKREGFYQGAFQERVLTRLGRHGR
jgi:hypothetical protein